MIHGAIGLWVMSSGGMPVYPPLTFDPISRIQSGGGIAKPAQLAVLGVGIEWDTEDIIIWDDDTEIGWEA